MSFILASFKSLLWWPTTYPSLEPSGKIPEGISTKSFPSTSMVSQVTSRPSTTSTLKHKFEATCAFAKPLRCPKYELLALTVGSFMIPTPLPSATSDITAWGASGTPPRPATERYTVSLGLPPETKINRIISLEKLRASYKTITS